MATDPVPAPDRGPSNPALSSAAAAAPKKSAEGAGCLFLFTEEEGGSRKEAMGRLPDARIDDDPGEEPDPNKPEKSEDEGEAPEFLSEPKRLLSPDIIDDDDDDDEESLPESERPKT